MGFEVAGNWLGHADDELRVDALAFKPALGSQGLDQAVRTPWQAATSARYGKGDALYKLDEASLQNLG